MRIVSFLAVLVCGCSSDRDLNIQSHSGPETGQPNAYNWDRKYKPFEASPPKFDERLVHSDRIDLDDPHSYEVLEMLALYSLAHKERDVSKLSSDPTRDHYSPIDYMNDAIRKFERLIEEQDPSLDEHPEIVQARLFCNRGIAHWYQGQKEEAVRDFSRAIQRDPDRWEYYYHRWNILYSLDRFSDAESDRKKGHELKPEMFPARVHGGVI